MMSSNNNPIPIIDVTELIKNSSTRLKVAEQINAACREYGSFYVIGHDVNKQLEDKLEQLSRQFFSQSIDVKEEIRMGLGVSTWSGYFPVGDELTSGKADIREGIFFGVELNENHPLVQNKTPLHGPNLFPKNIPEFKETVLEYINAMTQLGHTIMAGIALAFNLEESYFSEFFTENPMTIFRIINYPARKGDANDWGVGEHTDFGILTILKQDESGGLQFKSEYGWIEAPPIAGAFICNVGDMLQRMTNGLYKSSPHRVKSPSASRDRISFPFFFHPNFDAEINPFVIVENDSSDKVHVHEFQGTYGKYLLSRVSKTFTNWKNN